MARYDLAGRTALVTGAARGIGLETARGLARRGAHVVLVDLDADAVAGAAAALGGGAVGLAADVTDGAAMEGAVAAAVERFGGLDVVVANAGIGSRGATAAAMDPGVFERVVDVDLLGVWRTVRPALPEVARRRGHLVLVASIYAFANGVGAAPYAVSKAGVEALGRALRVELAQHGASCGVAYFGFVDTQLVQSMIDADPLADRMRAALPAPLRKRLPAPAAGEALVASIERRAPRVVRPRRWAAVSALRGVLNPVLDAHATRDPRIQGIARELDARAGQRQPTSA